MPLGRRLLKQQVSISISDDYDELCRVSLVLSSELAKGYVCVCQPPCRGVPYSEPLMVVPNREGNGQSSLLSSVHADASGG